MSENKIILDLCGGTGAWSRPYAEAGYDVRIITLPDYDITDYCVQEVLYDCETYGVLAAPPCNEFSIAKGSQPRDFAGAMEIVIACLRVIWQCHPAFWCLENPVGFLRQFLGKPPLTIKYWEFGDGLDKPTDLWGYFNFPKKKYSQPSGLLKKVRSMPGGTKEERDIHRAQTPTGFAEAFFEANR